MDLGSNATVTLTLRDAPVADVIGLLVRRAGLNVVLTQVDPEQTISLDVQDAPIQEVFNFIVRLNFLEVSRTEQTVIVGSNLAGVQERIVRTFRLNQASTTDVVNYLQQFTGTNAQIQEAITSERSVSIDGEGSVQVTVSGTEGSTQGNASSEAGLSGVSAGERATFGTQVVGGFINSPLLGVGIVADERTNSITAFGTSQQLDFIAGQIAQLDIRNRQVMISVRVVDVQLEDNESLSFGVGGSSGNFAIDFLNPGASGGFWWWPIRSTSRIFFALDWP
ncbi:MAG: hypothetical protein HC924_07765 [Synechococcaceae cyanobacterium SM2_3_2]|nr:hypothetical protein [Synechococcaceae cyanobacterium SM2_3_2]